MGLQAPAYYTDEITLLPPHLIWRFASAAGPFAPFLFARFYLRKLLRLPYRANYGAPYPDSLSICSIDQLPSEARDAFARLFPDFTASGFTLLFCTVTSFIGAKWGASAVFLHSEGDVYASAVWLRIKLDTFDRAETMIACHSQLSSGATYSTSPMPINRYIPEMIPAGATIQRLPEATSLSETLRIHRDSLRSLASPPVRLDQQRVQEQALLTMQRFYDHVIAKNLYRRLSDKEVNRLLPTSEASN